MIDTNITINKLYSFIAKLLLMLEEELDEFKFNRSKSAVIVKKNLTDMLNKLVTLTIQLNKLSKENSLSQQSVMPIEDQAIIEKFLSKYLKSQ